MQSRTALVGTLVLAAGLILISPRRSLSPGPVTQGHAQIAGDCLSCHTPLRGVPGPKCIACHPLDSIGVAHRSLVQPANARPALAGMHGEFRNADCLDCHTDHAGPDPARATRPFAHQHLTPSLLRRCSGCHEGSLPTDDLHRQVGNDCVSCHTTRAWTPASFEHDSFFVLDRDHSVACKTCHIESTVYKQYTCYGCHEHSPTRIAGKHREEGISDFRDCVRCHRSAEGEGGESGEGHRGGHEGERDD
jgi:hypothetical protein